MSEDKKTMEIRKREKLRHNGNEAERLLNEVAILILSDDYSDVECD